MNVATLRKIDRYVGIPVCFVLSLLRWILRRPQGEPRKVLIIQLSEMGSLALALPAVREMQERIAPAEMHFLVFSRNRRFLEILRIVPDAKIWTIDDGSLGGFVRSTFTFMRRARQAGIDTVLDFELFSRASMILSVMSGAGRRAGFTNYRAEGLYRGNLLTHPVGYNPHLHITRNFAAMGRALATDCPEQPALKETVDIGLTLPKIDVTPEQRAAMRERVAACGEQVEPTTRLLLLSPFSGNLLPIRSWPAEHYIRFIEIVLEKSENTALVVMGLPEAREYCESIFRAVQSPRLIDFIGRTRDIGEVIELLSICDLFVTTDSGPPHFASLTHCPTIVLFGPETPLLYAPLGGNVRCVSLWLHCSPCVSAFNHRDTPCKVNRCMIGITPETVAEMALEALVSKSQ